MPPSTRLVTPVFAVVTLATLFYFMAVGVMIPALPRYIKGPLGGGNAAVGVAVGAFALAAVVTRPFVGRFGDRRGRRILMVAGPLIVAVAVFLLLAAVGNQLTANKLEADGGARLHEAVIALAGHIEQYLGDEPNP